jgi:hypothetical protein
MFHPFSKRDTASGVRFCDGCAEVTTSADRSRRRLEATRAAALQSLSIR